MQNFAKNVIISRKKNNYGREIIDYDLIKLLMLSSQSSEFHKFFCCSYGFPQIFFRENIIREKVCEMRAKTFPFFSRTISFVGNPIYVAFCNVVCLVFCRVVCVVRVFKRTILLFLKTTVFKKLSVSFFKCVVLCILVCVVLCNVVCAGALQCGMGKCSAMLYVQCSAMWYL